MVSIGGRARVMCISRSGSEVIKQRTVAVSFLVSVFITINSLLVGLIIGTGYLGGNEVSLLILVVGLGLCYLIHRLTGDFLSPPFIMTAVWAFGLANGQLNIQSSGVYYNDPWTFSTWFSLIGALIGFLTGSFLVLRRARWQKDLGPIRKPDFLWDKTRLSVLIYLFFGLAFSTYVFFIIVAGGLPVLDPLPSLARMTFKLRYWGYLFSLFVPVIVLVTVRFVLFGNWRRNKVPSLIACLSILAMLSSGNRSDTLEAAIISVVSAILLLRFYQPRAKMEKRFVFMLIIIALALGFAFLYIQAVRLQGIGGVWNIQDRIALHNPYIANFFVYSGGDAVNNLQFAIESNLPMRYGALLFRAPLRWLGFAEVTEVQDIFDLWNTATFLYYYYLDFGYLGILIIPLVIGAIVSAIYLRLRDNPNPLMLIYYAIFVNAMIWSLVTERFFEVSTVYYLLVFTASHFFCRVRRIPSGLRVTGDRQLIA